MHFNVRSLTKNIDKLNECICDLKTKPRVIAITETILNQSRMSTNINIYGHNFIHYFCAAQNSRFRGTETLGAVLNFLK